jgi:hypothetical protein
MVASPNAHHLAYPKYQLQDTTKAVRSTGMHSTAARKLHIKQKLMEAMNCSPRATKYGLKEKKIQRQKE